MPLRTEIKLLQLCSLAHIFSPFFFSTEHVFMHSIFKISDIYIYYNIIPKEEFNQTYNMERTYISDIQELLKYSVTKDQNQWAKGIVKKKNPQISETQS